MSDPIRILHVLDGLGSGGAEAIVMNWYRNIDREKVQFDFLVRSSYNIYSNEISEMGGRVFVTPSYPRHYFSNKRATSRFLKEHAKDYAGIHVHGNALLYVNVFKIAKKNDIKFRIFHSHSTSTNFKYRWLHIFNRFRIKKMATDLFACSHAAGEWAFNSKDCVLIKNGIETTRFVYNEAKREATRKKLGISDNIVYGHVGRFVPVKNHNFLIDVFEKISQKEEKARLLLVGEGSLCESIKKKALEKGLSEKIIFAGRQDDVPSYMNAMDVFMLPSYYEGLGIVAIEAQSCGLPCLLSDTITREVKVTDLVDFLPLSDMDCWVAKCIEAKNVKRRNMQQEMKLSGYDVESSVRFLEEYYCSNSVKRGSV